MSIAEEWSKRSGRHQFIQKGQDGVVEYYYLHGHEVTEEEYYGYTKAEANKVTEIVCGRCSRKADVDCSC